MRLRLPGHARHPGNRQGDHQDISATYPMHSTLAQAGRAGNRLFAPRAGWVRGAGNWSEQLQLDRLGAAAAFVRLDLEAYSHAFVQLRNA